MHQAIYHYVDPADKAAIGLYIFGIGMILFIILRIAVGGLKSMDKEPTAIDYIFFVFLLTPICFIIMLTVKANVATEGKADLHEYLQKNYNIELSQEQTRQLYDRREYAEVPITRNGKQVIIKLKQISPDNYTLYENTADKPAPVSKEHSAEPKPTKTTQPTSKPTGTAKPQATPKPSPTPFDIKNLPPLVPTSVPSELTPSGK